MTVTDHATDRGVRRDATFLASRTPANLPAPQEEQWEWQTAAHCRGIPSEVFFLEEARGAPMRRREENAKRICNDCPVKLRCLAHALTAPETHGIWGATTPRERADIFDRHTQQP